MKKKRSFGSEMPLRLRLRDISLPKEKESKNNFKKKCNIN